MGKKKKRAAEFVLDCSVTVSWFFEDEADHYSESVEDSLATSVGVVPVLWSLEVANALLMGERRKRTTEVKVSAFLSLLKAMPIRADGETLTRAWQESIGLARAHALSVYDASYLELAMRRQLPLATLDTKLKAAARGIGIAEYRP